MGEVTIDGTLNLAQFFPTGESDADTAKVVVDVAPGAIRHRPDEGSSQPTTAYDGAYVKNFGKKTEVMKNGKVTVRLQGIDAPELHYQPQSMKELGSLAGKGVVKKYRQHQAETATIRLGQFLATLGPSPIPCRFFTHVIDEEGPGDAIDKYGRFVGNILIGTTDVNLEILRLGLAVVALYNSMSRQEIEACLAAAEQGKTAPDGIVKQLTATIGAFDSDLLYRKPPAPVQPEGTRKFIHPKLYRRQTTFFAYRKIGKFKSGFDRFLRLSKHDVFFLAAEYLADAPYVAVQLPIEKMVKEGRKVVYRPEQVIFKEAPSTLFNAANQEIESWED